MATVYFCLVKTLANVNKESSNLLNLQLLTLGKQGKCSCKQLNNKDFS